MKDHIGIQEKTINIPFPVFHERLGFKKALSSIVSKILPFGFGETACACLQKLFCNFTRVVRGACVVNTECIN